MLAFIFMVGEEEARRIDEEITARRKLLSATPFEVGVRTLTIRPAPDEVVRRIQQINGVMIEFKKKVENGRANIKGRI